jgi:hypothetical protein
MGKIENQELLNKAKEFGIDVDDDTKEDELKSTIEAKEKESKEKENDPNYLKSELEKMRSEAKKAFETRDSVKKERRMLQEKLKEVEDKLATRPEVDDFNDLKATLEELRKFKEEKEAEEEEKSLANKSELEKAQARHQKEMTGFQTQLDKFKQDMEAKENEHKSQLAEKDKELDRQRRRDLGYQIREAAEKSKAYNPRQIEKLLKDEFEFNKELGTWERFYKNERGKEELQTIEERVEEFLSDPDNDNLVESETRGGTGTRDTDKTKDKPKDKKIGGFDKDKLEKERLERLAEEKGLTVEEVKEIEEKKRAALEKRKQAK